MKTIVPAYGDYWLLTYRVNHPDNHQEVGKWQIIAWAIDAAAAAAAAAADGTRWIIVTPISNNGEESANCHDWAVLQPDGTVTRQGSDVDPIGFFVWSSLESWLQSRRRMRADERERWRKAQEAERELKATATAEVAPTAI